MQKIHIAARGLTITDWGPVPPNGRRLVWIDLTLSDGKVERREVTLYHADDQAVTFFSHRPADTLETLVALGLATIPPKREG